MNCVMRGLTITIATMLLNAALFHNIPAQEVDAYRRAQLYEPLIVAASIKHGVDPRLLWTVAWLESRFQPHVVSSAGAQGMMQFTPGAARRYGLRDPFDPAQAIDAAARYLRDLQEIFGPRLDLILAGYNAGESAVKAFRAGRRLRLPDGRLINPGGIKTTIPPYRETVNYVTNGAQIFATLIRSGYFSERRLARLLNIKPPKEQEKEQELETPILIDLEEAAADIAGLRKGSVYTIEDTPSFSAKRYIRHSVYAR